MNNLELMKKRIEHNRRKQEEDYQKEYNLRQAAHTKYQKISNPRKQDYLEEHNILPTMYDNDGIAVYLETPYLLLLLDRYYIQYVAIRNNFEKN